MNIDNCPPAPAQGMSFFERYLTIWVGLCILGGIVLGKLAPGLARSLDALAISVDGAPVISIPIALCLFFMMYPIMVKIDFKEVLQAGRAYKPVALTLLINWAVKPFTMYAIASWFLGTLLLPLIGAEAVDYVKLPLGISLEVGSSYGAGTVVLLDGVKMLEVPLWRSYLAGCILLGVAPCTAMVLVWSYLARGNVGHTLIMVAINSLTMLVLYGVIGGFLLGVGKLPVPWQALLLSIGVYVALPLVAGYFSRQWILAVKGEVWFREKFLHLLTPVTIGALLATLVLLFSFKGDVILANPWIILWIAIPLLVQTVLIFALGYTLAKFLGLSYENAAPTAMIGASNHFEVAIATSVMLFGLSSGAALATVVGVLIEVPLMLALVRFCERTRGWFGPATNSIEKSRSLTHSANPKVLFLCTGNSCRSQMAEGWARHLLGDRIESYSAGIEAHGMNPLAQRVMAEAGVDISGQMSKLASSLADVSLDLVVTVCGHADENCPAFLSKARVVHVGFDDPPKLARTAATEDEALGHYRRVRDEIRRFVSEDLERLVGQPTCR